MPINDLIQLRKGTGASWTSADPVLASGEPGFDVTNNLLKIGDGTTTWSNLNSVVTSDIQVYVKNTTGGSLTKGQAVYINGAQGNNATIQLSIAANEGGSSKTLGLLKQNLGVNEFGYVISEGILDGLDTNSATQDGDTMWLSPTVSGGIVYGTANKPLAPNHMVFLGYVLRKQSNNGRVYIKVQNGFELGELHNVAVNGASDGKFLQYNNSSGLWLASSSGNFTTLQVNGTGVSLSGHSHSSSDISNFNSSVSGLLPTIANSGDNRLLTSIGSTVGINGESNLTFDGSLLNITGSGLFSGGVNISNQTASTIVSFDSGKNLTSLSTAIYPSLTELSYVKGASSSIQTQLNSKASSSHTHTSTDISDWNEAVDDRVFNLLVGLSGINISYNDGSNTLSIAYTGSSGGGGGGSLNNIVEDTSPQLGGNLDLNTYSISGSSFYTSSTGTIIGNSGWIYQSGQVVLSNGSFSSKGDAQASQFILRNTTSNNSWTVLKNNNTNAILLASNRTYSFSVNIVGRRIDAQDNAAYKLEGLLYNDGYGSSIVGTPIKTIFGESDTSWDVRVNISGGGSGLSDYLITEVLGSSGKTINWVAKADLLEVGGYSDTYELNILNNENNFIP